jgi:hypothetical protein
MAFALVLAACGGGGGEPQAVGFDLSVHDRALEGDESTFVADQGDTVTFTINADEHGNLHLHGYDLRHDVGPDAPTAFSFEADATGRFAIEMHVEAAADHHDAPVDDHDAADDHEHDEDGVDLSLGTLEVRPR